MACISNKSSEIIGDAHKISLIGEVIKIIDDSTVELKATECEGDKIKVSDSVIVHYDYIQIISKNNAAESTEYENGEYKVKLGEQFYAHNHSKPILLWYFLS